MGVNWVSHLRVVIGLDTLVPSLVVQRSEIAINQNGSGHLEQFEVCRIATECANTCQEIVSVTHLMCRSMRGRMLASQKLRRAFVWMALDSLPAESPFNVLSRSCWRKAKELIAARIGSHGLSGFMVCEGER